LKKQLTENTILAADIAQFWQEVKSIIISVIASGDRSTATGDKVSGIINTGNNNLNVMC
jgi:predicted lipid-binding transport protein (Tim44 family)